MEKQTIADLLVIGAGVYGIQAARTYLDIHPEDEVVVLEADSHIGGAWAAHRSYDTFMTQSADDMHAFSDLPISGIPTDEMYHGHFPAKYFTRYLDDYTMGHVYKGRTLRSKILVNSRVEHLTKEGDLWSARVANGKVYTARKVIDADGLTSDPLIPEIPGQESFKGLQIHHKDFGQSKLATRPKLESVAVLGGAKSAADVAYEAAKAGKTVHWIIRKSGTGPGWFVPVYPLNGKAKSSSHELWVRFMGPLFVSIFAEPGPVTHFLHRSWLGQLIFWQVWSFFESKIAGLLKYDREDGRENGFFNLRPDTSFFWANDSTGTCNKPDFYDTIAKGVHVYREDVVALDESSLKLGNGDTIQADAIVYATGWHTAKFPYIDQNLAAHLGLSGLDAEHAARSSIKWQKLDYEADVQVKAEMPVLYKPPRHWAPKTRPTPMRLYKAMLPIADQSIAFVGKATIAHCSPTAEVQALWAVAALDGTLPIPSQQEMEKDVARTLAWARVRYLGRGANGMWFPWDTIPYADMLMKQLGLSSHRGKSKWKDLTEPLATAQLSGLIDEYRKKYPQKVGRRV